jgi:hypothetical protein
MQSARRVHPKVGNYLPTVLLRDNSVRIVLRGTNPGPDIPTFRYLFDRSFFFVFVLVFLPSSS